MAIFRHKCGRNRIWTKTNAVKSSAAEKLSALSGAWEAPGRNLATKIILMDSQDQDKASCIDLVALAASVQARETKLIENDKSAICYMKESSYNFFESTIWSAMIFYIKLNYSIGKNVKNKNFLAEATFALAARRPCTRASVIPILIRFCILPLIRF